MAGSTYAALVAVEWYQQSNIPGVRFAVADAEAMRDMLIQQMHVPPQNIKFWANEQATRSTFEHDLKYELDTLGPEDQFIFFYAGHGFYADGSNRLSTWETRSVNVGATTVCLDEVLLSRLKQGPCRKSLVFIDACSSTFNVPGTRSVLHDMRREEFDTFVQSTEYCGAFFSCSPAQQSYSSEKVQHGIWTYHLLQAFKGEDVAAFERDRLITGHSLQNYRTLRVPEFIAKKTEIKDSQRPYAVLAANGAFEILNVPERPPAPEQPDTKPHVPVPVFETAKAAADQQKYWEQRERLADTEVMTKIWGLPRWRLWSRPMEFRRARFQSLDHCDQFVASESVHSNARWKQYPWFNIPPEHGFESVAAEIDLVDQSVEHTERWVLFQSGQFVHNMALDRLLPHGKRTHVLEILEVITALYEFTARMADRKIFTNHVGIAIELQGVAGRQLAWREEMNLDGWCQEDSIGIDTVYIAEGLRTGRRSLALDAALSIYAQFGWDKPPREELAAEQRQRFGAK
jgi:hypothetical protein